MWLLFSRPHLHVFSVKSSFSGAGCLIHWLTHPVFRHNSCDKGLGAVKNQPWEATILAMHSKDPVLNQQYHALASTCHLTHLGRGGAVACQGHISVMQWASEVEEGWFVSPFLTRSRVGFVFTAPFARLQRQILHFWRRVPNSLVKSPCISAPQL